MKSINIVRQQKRLCRSSNTFLERFTLLSRRSSFSQCVDEHIHFFQSVVGQQNVIKDKHDIEKYTVDWTKNYVGGKVVCLPRNTEEISKLLKYCFSNNIGVVPQGGNTGLVGGAVGTFDGDEVILSLARMNNVVDFDKQSGIITCEAGCILENLIKVAEDNGYSIPLDLGAKGSCMIGGNIATNAGGLRVLKYGSLHENVLGLEVVLADGTVLDMLRSLHKDNCGYALKHLFIGSEGTLGIITRATLSLATKPLTSHVIFAKVSSFSMVAPLLAMARQQLGSNLSAFEFMDCSSIDAVRSAAPHLLTQRIQQSVLPIDTAADDIVGIAGEVAVLMETSGSDMELDGQRLDKFLTGIVDSGAVTDAVLSQDMQQEKALWEIRENVPVSLMQLSRIRHTHSVTGALESARRLFKYDVSLSLANTDSFLASLRTALLGKGFVVQKGCSNSTYKTLQTTSSDLRHCKLQLCNFGHAGDQNLHLNLLASVDVQRHLEAGSPYELIEGVSEASLPAYLTRVQGVISEIVYDLVISRKGSISAEHGVGQQKRAAVSLARSPAEVQLMHGLKTLLDPRNILNPHKVIPELK